MNLCELKHSAWNVPLSDSMKALSVLPGRIGEACQVVWELFHNPPTQSESGLGLVSRASPVQTAMRNCTRDEGGPFEVGNHGPISSRCKLLRSKVVVVSVAVNLGPKVQDGKVERGERKRTVDEVSKSD